MTVKGWRKDFISFINDLSIPRDDYNVLMEYIDDATTLLNRKESVLLENQHKPYGYSTNANSPWISRCPRCNKKVEGKKTRFCKYCGQAVRWE